MSWHFSQVLEAEYSAGSCSDGAQSAPSSGTDMHGTFWSPGKTTDVLKPSRSGMTFRLLTDDLGEAVLMSYLEAFPVRTFHAPEKVQESKATEAPCGSTWRESSAKFDRNSLSWKTHLCLWEEDLPSSSLTLPNWGMMRNGALWERITSPPLTSETESGCYLGTPTASMRKRSEKFAEGRLPTPAEYASQWPTPTCADATMEAILNDKTKFITLKSGRLRKISNQGISGSIGLARTVAMWATPQSRDFRTGQRSRWENPERTRNLNDQIGGQLNPTWVEWLMGWPLGWTDCGASATAKFRQWLNSHGKH